MYLSIFSTGFDTFTAYCTNLYNPKYKCSIWQQNQFGNNPYINACDYVDKYGLYTKNLTFKQNKPVMFEDLKQIIAGRGNDDGPNIKRFRNFQYAGVQVKQISISNVRFICYEIGMNWANPIDSITWDLSFLVPFQYRDTTIYNNSLNVTTWAFNNDLSAGARLFAYNVLISSTLKLKPDLKTYDASYIGILSLEQLHFKGPPELILLDKGETSKIPGDIIGPAPEGKQSIHHVFSPDGNTLYAVIMHSKYTGTNNYLSLETFRKTSGIWQRKDSILSSFRIESPAISPYGGLLIYTSNKLNSKSYFYSFSNANNPKQFIVKESPAIQSGFSSKTHHPYDYLRFDHSLEFKDCGAYLKFANRCDESFGIDTYEWWIAKNKEQTDFAYFKGQVPPSVFYNTEGVYFVKVHGTNSKDPDGYAEWWWDSIKITIPAKPKASFAANPRLYCLGSQVTFNNTSNQGQINPNKTVQYFWNFGDGDTSSKTFPKHLYKLPGQYDISLEVDNGYCRDTLFQKQYINIVDAPQPGFTLSSNEGCTPFEIKVTEKNTRPLIARQYEMSSSLNVAPDTSFFNFIYQQKGRYKIYQHLYSASGCESLDSAEVIVHRGFTVFDSSHMYNGSYATNQTITLNWLPVPDAKTYKIFGGTNSQLISLTTLPANVLNYTVTIPNPAKYSFQVIAYDSCGKPSQQGRASWPIYLSNSQDENRSVTLNYTSYFNWDVPIIKYEIYFTPNSSSAVNNGTALTYVDFDFAKTAMNISDTMQCYLVKATGTDGRETWSNFTCAKRKPEVFLPTAFTPDANGLNDIYKPAILGIRNYELAIYNRWGQQVCKEKNGGWKSNGASSGVYVAVFNGVDLNGKNILITQTIHVLR